MNPSTLPHGVLPPEWAPQDALMITWPHAETDWGPALDEVERVWVEIALAVTPRQRLWVVAHDEAVAARVRALLGRAGVAAAQVDVWIAPCDDTWARDHGPLTVGLPGEAWQPLDFTFNGWGGRFPSDRDDAITANLGRAGAFQRAPVAMGMVLEGGSVEVDGQGSLLTTRRCLLNPNRNPKLSQGEIEDRLRRAFGVEQLLWLEHGHLEGDDTDAHIDTLARFAPERGIVYVSCDDPEDPHFAPLQAMERELEAMRDVAGRPYRLWPLPWPSPKYGEEGLRLAASYANYVIINGAVLVPTYRDRRDAEALQVVAEAHPGRRVIGVDCLGVIQQGGSLHCLTMQLPRGATREA
ncbi:MAG: agmatine deiminase [Myxococcales bacterium]|nr:agmatine deiminase [Myxococcales bacterium]